MSTSNQEQINKLNKKINFLENKLSKTFNNVDRGDISERIRLIKEEIAKLSISNNKKDMKINNIIHSDAAPIADRIEKNKTIDNPNGQFITKKSNIFKINI